MVSRTLSPSRASIGLPRSLCGEALGMSEPERAGERRATPRRRRSREACLGSELGLVLVGCVCGAGFSFGRGSFDCAK